MKKIKSVFISGINGQDGSYLAEFLYGLGFEVHGSLRSSQSSLFNLKYLNLLAKLKLYIVDLENFNELSDLLDKVKPKFIFNLAAQSSVEFSFREPYNTLRPNVIILLNFLEYLRKNPSIKLYHSSSSEMYGNPVSLPIRETHDFNPISPYGLSKSIGYQAIILYRELYKLFIVNGIMFNHESFLRNDQFFVKKVIKQSIRIKFGLQKHLVVGNLDIKRDFGFTKDYVVMMYQALNVIKPDDYIFSSGSSVSLREIVYYVFDKLEISLDKLEVSNAYFRPNEILDIYGDNTKAKNILNFDYSKSIWDLLDILIDEELQTYD